MNSTAQETQYIATKMLREGVIDVGMEAELNAAVRTRIGTTGDLGHDAYDGACAEFDRTSRVVYLYKDEDGTWMLDAHDAAIGIPAPQPYSRHRLFAYLIWAVEDNDSMFAALAEASRATADA